MAFRPPAVPLITHDPYFSVWSFHDRLTDDWTRHWTGSVMALIGMARIDGKPFRWSGTHQANRIPAMEQKNLTVTPTRSIYTFEASGVRLTVTFLSPLLPYNLDRVSEPITYLTLEAASIDGRPHDVRLYADVTGEWVVNSAGQEVVWNRYQLGKMDALRIGTYEQPVLEKVGDNLRIDWGYLYFAGVREGKMQSALGTDTVVRTRFIESGELPESDDLRMPRRANDNWPVLGISFDLGRVERNPVSRRLMLAYDDLFALEYFHRPVRAYWKRTGKDIGTLLESAEKEQATLEQECRAFDDELTADLTRVGGEGFAQLTALSYRQCFAAHKLAVDADGQPLYMSKENFSNGCIDTVDVTYPSAPFFLLFNPELLKAQLTPIIAYANSPRWKFPFAPHDLGTYPKANGQVYGGGEQSEENQMPVEECGNMLLLVAALTKAEGNADYAREWWNTLTQWADYLMGKGLDPENQLCTDDFAGHLAHNANLPLKAILAIGGWAMVCEMAGKKDEARRYRDSAAKMAQDWQKMANDGMHYRLAFDRPGTWSQKYNLVWDEILQLNLFPQEVGHMEMVAYRNRLKPYGLPLDNRATYTKLDWCVWTATLSQDRSDFDAVVAPLVKWMNETPTRVPLTDWYDTVSGKMVGFQARSVVGGVYIPLLYNASLWRKWREKAKSK
ncbi:MAG: hypothetical protein OHK0029_35770 [Armatimonadaceae bacterium]